ncbi:hypothetical protein B0J13DRAFT_170568 [Dactylonectria estremocensis]|uniref:Uncharacterized protein n=1 Tax=Dactylonectria estremocensis TaxID=1079267 RepID=A0A9P9J9K9_9HYPO|nr:hypothetical protein B0J13DRAFT_170568 [Dactylonectria estremocensis]
MGYLQLATSCALVLSPPNFWVFLTSYLHELSFASLADAELPAPNEVTALTLGGKTTGPRGVRMWVRDSILTPSAQGRNHTTRMSIKTVRNTHSQKNPDRQPHASLPSSIGNSTHPPGIEPHPSEPLGLPPGCDPGLASSRWRWSGWRCRTNSPKTTKRYDGEIHLDI